VGLLFTTVQVSNLDHSYNHYKHSDHDYNHHDRYHYDHARIIVKRRQCSAKQTDDHYNDSEISMPIHSSS